MRNMLTAFRFLYLTVQISDRSQEQLVAKKVAGRFASQGLVALRELGDVAVEKVTLPE